MDMLADNIKDILYGYVREESISNSAGEKGAQRYFLDFFGKQEYFQKHPEYFGAFSIEDDPFGRAAAWAMVRGEGDDTVVLIHHYDVVTVEDFKTLKSYAFSPDELEKQLMPIKDSLSGEARADLESGKWLFGRGVCDMKGGGSIQMALLSEYAKRENLKGNVIVLAVPDEENLSAGMRAGVILLDRLKKKYGLRYRLMANSEPHQRKTDAEGVFSFGSIGKLMPFVYVRGVLAHAGKVFEGLNPSNIMCEIVRRTELNMDLSDTVRGEAAPPPTWLYLRDNKLSYDVSMPLTVTGCLSVLTLCQSPKTVMGKLRDICEEAFDTVLMDMEKNYRRFAEASLSEASARKAVRTDSGSPGITGNSGDFGEAALPWKSKAVYFGELLAEAEENYGEAFREAYVAELEHLYQKLHRGEESLITANFALVDFVYDYIDDLSPRVVIGLVPPYYPNVSNAAGRGADGSASMEDNDGKIAGLYGALDGFTREQWGQGYIREEFYTGISDLSYSSIADGEAILGSLKEAMPFFGKIYGLPLAEIQDISMPCVNIGPWGKDFHKLTERVLKEDLYVRTPGILDFAVRYILGWSRQA